MEPRELLDILHLAERLKDTTRHCYTSKGRRESVAEHSWRAALTAYFLKDAFPEADMGRVIQMCLIHDLGEAFTGDIPAFDKTKADEEKEESLLKDWVRSLPAPFAGEMAALYAEMEQLETVEAKIYKAIDGLEAVVQHNESDLSTWIDREYHMNLTYAEDKVAFSPALQALRRAIREDTEQKILEGRMNSINDFVARLTTPYKDIFTTVYLVKTAQGALLFDAASYDADAEKYLLPFLSAQGLTQDDLKYIFISHPHSDHAGGLKGLLRYFPKAQVLCGSASIEKIHPGIPYRVIKEGEKVLGNLQAVAVPGHTQDSMALLDERTRTLISGDGLQLFGIYGSGKWGANISYPKAYLQAIRKLRGMEIEQILTAHDYHPLGYRYDGKEQVNKALDACWAPLERIAALIEAQPEAADAEICRLYHAGELLPTLGEHVAAAVRKMLGENK